MYDEILQAVIDMAETAAGVSIVTGSVPPSGGVAMTGQAATDTVFLNIGSNERMTVLCNGKDASQQTVIQRLDEIHRYLTRRKDFPSTPEWQIYAIETVASPRLIGREDNPRAEWLYGSSLLVKINMKGITV